MKRTFGLAAGALLFAAACGTTDAAESSSSRTSFDLLGQEATADQPEAVIQGPLAGKLGGTAFTSTLHVTRFVAEKGTVYLLGKLHDVTGLAADAAAKLEGSDVKLPLSVQPEGGFPTDGAPPSCEAITLWTAPAELASDAGALSLERFDVDFTFTPGGSQVIAFLLCPSIPGVLEAGGALTGITADISDFLLQLNSMAGVNIDEEEAATTTDPSGTTDAAATDAGATDAGTTDAGATATNAGTTDAGATDAAAKDAGRPRGRIVGPRWRR